MVGSKKVPMSKLQEQLENICWHIWNALEILPNRCSPDSKFQRTVVILGSLRANMILLIQS
jgi:hypothetical protein